MDDEEDTKRYYWLKLKRDFFKRHDIRIIEGMPNGKDYLLFYLKMLLESIDHNGELRFSETIPYSEQMLSVITNTNIDIVRSAMKMFVELGMVEILDDKTIFMAEVKKMTGAETKWAEKKRLYRGKEDTPRTLSLPCPPDVRQEKEIRVQSNNTPLPPNGGDGFDEFWSAYPRKVGKAAARKAYTKVIRSVMPETLLTALRGQISSPQWLKDNGAFIPHPTTWLNQGRWEDELPENENEGAWDAWKAL
jgi:predicted phage replisome organizer